jgi:hypothetical protein
MPSSRFVRSTSLAASLALTSSLLTAQVIFDTAGFESPGYVTGELHTQNDWSAYVGHVLVDGAGRDGSRGAVFPADSGNFYAASRTLADPAFSSTSRYTLGADLSLGAGNREGIIVHTGLSALYTDSFGTFGLGVGRAGLLHFGGNVLLAAFTSLNNANQPDPLGENVGWFVVAPVSPLAFDSFHRIVLDYDFGAQRYSVTLNTELVLSDIPFPYAGVYEGLDFLSIEADDLFTDNEVLDGSSAVDNLEFKAALIPEPASFATLLGGAALVVMLSSRRRKMPAASAS